MNGSAGGHAPARQDNMLPYASLRIIKPSCAENFVYKIDIHILSRYDSHYWHFPSGYQQIIRHVEGLI